MEEMFQPLVEELRIYGMAHHTAIISYPCQTSELLSLLFYSHS